MMNEHHASEHSIQLKLFATLTAFLPAGGERVPIEPGITVGRLMARLAIPAEKTRLIFIDGRRGTPDSELKGGERVGLFPPVGGG